MNAQPAITSQDWYRVRRGEDQIAWGNARIAPDLPDVVFSYRSSQEFAFLEPEQQTAVREALLGLSAAGMDERGEQIEHSGGRCLFQVDALRIVFRSEEDTISISTIRGGRVLDPENLGPPPGGDGSWRPAPARGG